MKNELYIHTYFKFNSFLVRLRVLSALVVNFIKLMTLVNKERKQGLKLLPGKISL